MGQFVARLDTLLLGHDIAGIPPGQVSLRINIPKMPLMPGRYQITILSWLSGTIVDSIGNAAAFEVMPGAYFATGHLPAHNRAMFLLDHEFVLGGVLPSTLGKSVPRNTT